MVRLILGFIASALWLPVFAYFADSSYGKYAFVWIAIFTVPLTVLVAAPLYYFFRRRVNLWACMGFGAMIGALGGGLFFAMTHFEAFLNWAPLLIGAGWMSSVVFWVVGIWGNRNLTLTSTGTPGGARQ